MNSPIPKPQQSGQINFRPASILSQPAKHQALYIPGTVLPDKQFRFSTVGNGQIYVVREDSSLLRVESGKLEAKTRS